MDFNLNMNLNDSSKKKLDDVVDLATKKLGSTLTNAINTASDKVNTEDIKLSTNVNMKFDIADDLHIKLFRCIAPILGLVFMCVVIITFIQKI